MKDRFWVNMANFCIRRTSPRYQALLGMTLFYGLKVLDQKVAEGEIPKP